MKRSVIARRASGSTPGSKPNATVADGNLNYIDHTTGMHVKSTSVTAYTDTSANSRHFEGAAEINGQGGFTYMVDVVDNGEPGRHTDTFSIRLSNGYSAGGKLEGGNIQLHKPCP